MREIRYVGRFKRDYKREKSGKHGKTVDVALMEVVRLLAADETLPRRNFDHPLSGDWTDHRDCHIKPDLILITRITRFIKVYIAVKLNRYKPKLGNDGVPFMWLQNAPSILQNHCHTPGTFEKTQSAPAVRTPAATFDEIDDFESAIEPHSCKLTHHRVSSPGSGKL